MRKCKYMNIGQCTLEEEPSDYRCSLCIGVGLRTSLDIITQLLPYIIAPTIANDQFLGALVDLNRRTDMFAKWIIKMFPEESKERVEATQLVVEEIKDRYKRLLNSGEEYTI